MNPNEAYERFLIKSEKNSINDNLSTSKGTFALLYNEFKNRFSEYCYEKKNEDDFRYIQTLLVLDHKINVSKSNNTSCYFKLPTDYFEFSNVYGIGSKGNCKNQKFTLYEIKGTSSNIIDINEYTSPSFNYRESNFIFGGNNIKVFTDDFTIDKIVLDYYRYPRSIILEDTENPESNFVNIELDFDDKVNDRIISAMVGGFDLNNTSERWQLHNLSSKTKL